MTPEKTGAYIFLEEYGEYVVGDLYKYAGGLILKGTMSKPMHYPERDINGVCSRVDERWTMPREGLEVIFLGDFLYYGYEGLEREKFIQALRARKPLGHLLDHRGRNKVS